MHQPSLPSDLVRSVKCVFDVLSSGVKSERWEVGSRAFPRW